MGRNSERVRKLLSICDSGASSCVDVWRQDPSGLRTRLILREKLGKLSA